VESALSDEEGLDQERERERTYAWSAVRKRGAGLVPEDGRQQ
jgi:hypothetical protein